ncbi:MAG: hydroxymethylglutaryl-CoA lyase [Candidatus Eremiobacteraeota bacterium]|nr:hydroxymethylglutaryl-CoA lyase [Candidatus Eremiobacteraeota bacterium]MCW5866147.1 hydroxymethylglutaryl-CoA lyase [Candidatus Eremiobacteraeota bacterium]
MIRLVEVGPRDGLQNEKEIVPVEVKLQFIEALARAGYQEIEATSFVSPRWIPQLADAEEVSHQLKPHDGLVYTALIPNRKGLQRALDCGYRRVAVFTAASEAFSQKNTNRSISQSLEEFAPLVEQAGQAGVSVRGYVSTAWWCPYAGRVDSDETVKVAEALIAMGIEEVSLGDTVGLAVPSQVELTLEKLHHHREKIALHFHDTSGTALANVLRAYQMGFTVFDCSAGGLGGCPYAPGASGNLASEDILYMFEQMGVTTGVDLRQVARASLQLATHLGRKLPGRTLARLQSQL